MVHSGEPGEEELNWLFQKRPRDLRIPYSCLKFGGHTAQSTGGGFRVQVAVRAVETADLSQAGAPQWDSSGRFFFFPPVYSLLLFTAREAGLPVRTVAECRPGKYI